MRNRYVWFQKYPCRSSMAREGVQIPCNVSSCWITLSDTMMPKCCWLLSRSFAVCHELPWGFVMSMSLWDTERRAEKHHVFKNCRQNLSNLFHPSCQSSSFYTFCVNSFQYQIISSVYLVASFCHRLSGWEKKFSRSESGRPVLWASCRGPFGVIFVSHPSTFTAKKWNLQLNYPPEI